MANPIESAFAVLKKSIFERIEGDTCEHCGEPIGPDDEYVPGINKRVHEHCFYDFMAPLGWPGAIMQHVPKMEADEDAKTQRPQPKCKEEGCDGLDWGTGYCQYHDTEHWENCDEWYCPRCDGPLESEE